MKQTKLYFFITLTAIIFLFNSCIINKKNLTKEPVPLSELLSKLDGVQFEKAVIPNGYKEAYKLKITQPIDHNNPNAGTFTQLVWLSFKGYDRPVVIITDGYDNPLNSVQEISNILNCNQLLVEHRFFGESVPDSIDWTKLNLFQAANDLHHIRELFSNIFPLPWISSGISKGGQTTIAYKYYFPDDVSAAVPYVAPHTFAREDERVLDFIANKVSSDKNREKVIKFQHDVLANKDTIMPLFINFAKKQNMTFEAVGGYESGFEHGLLEFSFAFWQWGYSCSDIPNNVLNLDSTMRILKDINPFDFFSDQNARELRPYFYQALTEMGIYTYTTEPFEEYLEYAKNPTFDFTMENKIQTEYSNELNLKIDEWLKTEGNNFIYIYGGLDPWGSCAVDIDTINTNALKFVHPNGAHDVRIYSFDKKVKYQIIDSLEKWSNFDF